MSAPGAWPAWPWRRRRWRGRLLTGDQLAALLSAQAGVDPAEVYGFIVVVLVGDKRRIITDLATEAEARDELGRASRGARW